MSVKIGKNVKEMFEMIIKEIDESLDLFDIDLYVISYEIVVSIIYRGRKI